MNNTNGKDYVVSTPEENIVFPNGTNSLYILGYKDGIEVAQKKLQNDGETFEPINFTEEKIETIVNPEPYIRGYYDGMCKKLCMEPDSEFIDSLISPNQK